MSLHAACVIGWISLSVLLFLCSPVAVHSKRSRTGIATAGDIILGGLIPVHFSPNFASHPGNSSCSGAFHLRGYKGVEAMLYSVNLINKNATLLPNVTLGVDIKDTCGSVDYAIMESLSFDFIRRAFTASERSECTEYRNRNNPARQKFAAGNTGPKINGSFAGSLNDCSSRNSSAPTVAIIGAAFSGVTMAIASLAGLFHVPVISYASTSRLLCDRSRFQYFYRTVPSDSLQAHAMTDLLIALKWQFIIVLASDNEYGRSGITALKQAIQNHTSQRICVVVDELFSRKGTQEEMASIFKKINQFSKARVIILYAEFPDAVYFFKEAKKASLREYMFVASDSWVGSSEVIKDADGVFHSILGLRPPVNPVPEFDSFFSDRLLRNSTENPWAADLNESTICPKKGTGQCQSEVHHEGYVSYVMDAVFSVAHALHAILNCSNHACAKKLNDVELRGLSQYIKKVTFEGFSQKHIFYNDKGSTRGKYDIYYLREGISTYQKVGSWSESNSLSLNGSSRMAEHGTSFQLPASVCNNDCRKGEFRIPKSQFPECCWNCVKCNGKSFTNTSKMTSCVDCPDGTWPTADHSDCRPIEASYLHWGEAWAAVIVFLSLFGLVLVICTCATFIKFRGTAVVRAASTQLCHVLLLGIAMFFVTPLPYIVKPSVLSCRVLPFMFGLCFVLVVGTILIRTNRVSRIFNEKLLRTGSVSCLGNYWQLFILGCLLTTEIVLSVGWVFGSSNQVSQEIIYSKSSKDASLICNLTGSKIGFSLWLIFNAGLVIVCTYQAFLVRKVPQNYNESRLIAFTMTTFCITALVYIPSYMGTTAWYRTIISCFMFLFLGTLTWASIFAPKIYIILFRPHKNVPMRPSVSSITLGVIMPSPTLISNLGDQPMRSRQNSANHDESLELGSRGDFDLSRQVSECEATDDLNESREMAANELGIYSGDDETQTNMEVENSKTNTLDALVSPETVCQQKTIIVHFEEEIVTENVESTDTAVTPRKKSSGSQGGILRKPCTSENLENLNGLSVKKKKTSLVRFQDEVANFEFDDLNCNKVPPPPKSNDLGNQPCSIQDNVDKNVLNGCRVSSDERNSRNGAAQQGRKRKVSVFSFE